MIDHGTYLEESEEYSVHLNASIEATSFALDSNSIKVMIDGSLFLERSVLMSTAQKFFSNDILLATRFFLSETELQHRNACSS